jgi:hypothetical protein
MPEATDRKGLKSQGQAAGAAGHDVDRILLRGTFSDRLTNVSFATPRSHSIFARKKGNHAGMVEGDQ